MKMSETQIVEALEKNLLNDFGRHLYAILGSASQLEHFEEEYIPHLKHQEEDRTLGVINLNNSILDDIDDAELRNIINAEARLPKSTQDKLNKVFDSLLNSLLSQRRVLILKQIELLFAYEMDLQLLRARAANQNHIILLVPGELQSDHVRLFTNARPQFQRPLPAQLITEDHLWEIQNAK